LLPYVEVDSLTKLGCATSLLGDGSVRKSLAEEVATFRSGSIQPQDLGGLDVLGMARAVTGSLFNGSATALCDGSVRQADDASLRATLAQVSGDLLGALHFGAGGESLSFLPAVQFSPEKGSSRDLVFELADTLVGSATPPSGPDVAVGGVTGLCNLVEASADPKVAKTFCKRLASIDKADVAGKFTKRAKLLDAFRTKLAKQVGHGINGSDADLLSDLSFLLVEEEGVSF